MYTLCTGKAKQNYAVFNRSGKLAALLHLLKYSAHFSWDMREERFGLLKILLNVFEKDKHYHLYHQ
jgi:hypothetical protein